MYHYKTKMALVKPLIGGNLMGKDEMNSKSNKTWTDTYENEIKRMIKGIRDPRLMRYIYLIVKDAISENIDR
jgi:hypothetical protein